jgi:hypothetical protein
MLNALFLQWFQKRCSLIHHKKTQTLVKQTCALGRSSRWQVASLVMAVTTTQSNRDWEALIRISASVIFLDESSILTPLKHIHYWNKRCISSSTCIWLTSDRLFTLMKYFQTRVTPCIQKVLSQPLYKMDCSLHALQLPNRAVTPAQPAQ